MREGSLIDDVDFGNQILFPNSMIRRMLNLAGAGANDIFYDLGCGWGQNLIIASTEFKVKECVGIESELLRAKVAKDRISKRDLRNIRIEEKGIDEVLAGKVDVGIENATIVFYGLPTESADIDKFNKKLQDGCKLIYFFDNGVYPEIVPDLGDYPFYLSKKPSVKPFRGPANTLEWLSSIIKKEESTIHKGRPPDEEELWDEFYHDLNICLGERSGQDCDEYRERLRKFLSKKHRTSRK